MNADLTTSPVARNNVLNNTYALSKLETHLALGRRSFEEQTLFTKGQVSEILAVDERTIDCHLSANGEELKASGHIILKGKALKNLKKLHVDDTHVVDINTTSQNFLFTIPEALLMVESSDLHG